LETIHPGESFAEGDTFHKEDRMSDYNPNDLGPNRDRYGRDPAYGTDSGNSGFALLAILAGVALVGGFLYFANPQNNSEQQAQTPPTTERTLTPKADPNSMPGIDRPKPPGSAAPTAPQE
jgi:hypothetical protein